jgi:hypothetical protein
MTISEKFRLAICMLTLLISQAESAEITLSQSDAKLDISLTGTIENGDYEKFVDAIREVYAPAPRGDNIDVVWVNLDLAGGSTREAMRIGRLIRELLLITDTGVRVVDSRDLHCDGSCFLIWASGVVRFVGTYPWPPLRIHRPSLSWEDTANLTQEQAREDYRRLEQETRAFLQDMDVSGKYADEMFRTASNEPYRLVTVQ